MKPNLTAGLFLNGRFSAAAPGMLNPMAILVISDYNIATDLAANDMAFEDLNSSPKEMHEDSQPSTSGSTDKQEDETSNNIGASLQQHTGCPTTSFENKDRDKKETVSCGFQVDSNSVDGTDPTTAPESPGAMLKRLIKTGIFDGTGIVHEKVQAGFIRDVSSVILDEAQPTGGRSIPDEVVVTASGKNLALLSTGQPPLNAVGLNKKSGESHMNTMADSLSIKHQDKDLSLYVHNTTQVHSLDLPDPATVKDSPKSSVNQNLRQDLETGIASATMVKRQSVSRTSEGGHRYIQCIDQENRPGPAVISPGGPDFEYLICSNDVQSPKFRSSKKSTFNEWQHYGETGRPQQSLIYRHPLHLTHEPADVPAFTPELLPIPLSEVHSIYDERGNESSQVDERYPNHDNETLQEFFERIEGEVNIGCNDTHQTVRGNYFSDDEGYIEDELQEIQHGLGGLQSSNLYCSQERKLLIDDAYPDTQTEIYPHLLGSHESSGVQIGGLITRNGNNFVAPDVEMLDFWRPNHF